MMPPFPVPDDAIRLKGLTVPRDPPRTPCWFSHLQHSPSRTRTLCHPAVFVLVCGKLSTSVIADMSAPGQYSQTTTRPAQRLSQHPAQMAQTSTTRPAQRLSYNPSHMAQTSTTKTTQKVVMRPGEKPMHVTGTIQPLTGLACSGSCTVADSAIIREGRVLCQKDCLDPGPDGRQEGRHLEQLEVRHEPWPGLQAHRPALDQGG